MVGVLFLKFVLFPESFVFGGGKAEKVIQKMNKTRNALF
jgi:hypothetical protein